MQICDGLYMPLFPGCKLGGSSNAYAIRTGDGIIVIDGGLASDLPILEERFAAFDLRLEDIRLLIATHCHFDHYEMFPRLKAISGAKVLAHAKDADILESGDYRTGWHVKAVSGQRPVPLSVAVDQRLEDGDEIALGGALLRVVHTPGHTEGCICLQAEFHGRKALFSGDVVQPGPPPGGKTGWEGSPTQNLGDYRESLRRLCALDVDWLLAGHGNPCLREGWRPISLAANRFFMDHPEWG